MKALIAACVAGAIALGALGGTGWRTFQRPVHQAESTPVRIEPAVRGELIEVVSAPGQVQPKVKVSIGARVSARVVELPFEEGDRITKGSPTAPPSVLARLDDKDLQASLRSVQAKRAAQAAEIDVARTRLAATESRIRALGISLAESQRDLGRFKTLLAANCIAPAEVDTAQSKADRLAAELESETGTYKAEQTNLAVMQENLNAAQAEVERARDALNDTTITAPIDGVLTRLNVKVGEMVVTGTMNNPGTVLMEVADMNRMLLVARVDEAAIAQMKPGQKAAVRLQAYPDQVFTGTVQTVALSSADDDKDGSRYFKTEIRLDTRGRMIPSGLEGDAEIECQKLHSVIKVPSQAILARTVSDLPAEVRDRPEVDQNRTTTTVVYRNVGGRAVVTPVKIGPSDATDTVVTSGLAEGDPVIIGPYKVLDTLGHGQQVSDDGQGRPARPTTDRR